MSLFRLQIVMPDGCAFDGEAEAILLCTSEGYVSIRAGHMDYIATLAVSEVVVTENGVERHAACGGGFVSVTSGEVRLVTTTFEYADEIDVKRAESAREKAEAKLKSNLSDRDLALAKAKLMRALNRLDVAGKI